MRLSKMDAGRSERSRWATAPLFIPDVAAGTSLLWKEAHFRYFGFLLIELRNKKELSR